MPAVRSMVECVIECVFVGVDVDVDVDVYWMNLTLLTFFRFGGRFRCDRGSSGSGSCNWSRTQANCIVRSGRRMNQLIRCQADCSYFMHFHSMQMRCMHTRIDPIARAMIITHL